MKDNTSRSGASRKGPRNWRFRRGVGGTAGQAGNNGSPQDSDERHDPDLSSPEATSGGANDVEDAEFSMNVVETVTFDPNQPPLRSLPNVHGELIRKLRTELLLRHGYNNTAPLGFAVVSTTSGDGRSLLAAELALSFAQLSRSTLLIDGDLRSPRQHHQFGTEVPEGLAQTLAFGGTPKLSGVEGIPSLSVLAAGDDTGHNPTELFSSMHFKRTIDAMRNLFDFIIVDTPPFNDYSDAQIISAVMGRVMTLHRANVSSYRDTRTMLASLERSRTEVFGGVLNQF